MLWLNSLLYIDKCYRYKVDNETVLKTIDDQLSCEMHEEADTKIVYHVSKIDSEANVMIKCSDTDILITMLGNMKYLNNSLHIWMDASVANNKKNILTLHHYMKI